jgi:hypothetical protein
MEAQDYVSKIVRQEKVHRAMVTKLQVTKYQKCAARTVAPHQFATLSPIGTGYTGPERLFRSVLAAWFEPAGK